MYKRNKILAHTCTLIKTEKVIFYTTQKYMKDTRLQPVRSNYYMIDDWWWFVWCSIRATKFTARLILTFISGATIILSARRIKLVRSVIPWQSWKILGEAVSSKQQEEHRTISSSWWKPTHRYVLTSIV